MLGGCRPEQIGAGRWTLGRGRAGRRCRGRLANVVAVERLLTGPAAGAEIESIDAGAQMVSADPHAIQGEHAGALLGFLIARPPREARDGPDVPPEWRNCTEKEKRNN